MGLPAAWRLAHVSVGDRAFKRPDAASKRRQLLKQAPQDHHLPVIARVDWAERLDQRHLLVERRLEA
ncbi:MAG TPA: hypothetical protein VE777_16625 [Gaiellales bacterium]|jgi:hypothetical protein|nr:hypothetical protein [Gaiellales bacterium]